ncbi:MAG: hypothetical protein M9947_16800 [Thermomicrobiales bacterium]|nr:hypothetical protein [Thermomicrobiales bacterium]
MQHELNAPPPLLVEESDEFLGQLSRGTWILIAAMVIGKIGLLVVVFSYDRSQSAGIFALISSWLWVIGLAFVLSGPATFAWRIRRMRARRTALQRSEWIVEDDERPVDHHTA